MIEQITAYKCITCGRQTTIRSPPPPPPPKKLRWHCNKELFHACVYTCYKKCIYPNRMTALVPAGINKAYCSCCRYCKPWPASHKTHPARRLLHSHDCFTHQCHDRFTHRCKAAAGHQVFPASDRFHQLTGVTLEKREVQKHVSEY